MTNKWNKKDVTFNGHVFETDEDGIVNIMAFAHGFHNGPKCILCGEGFCYHCDNQFPKCPITAPDLLQMIRNEAEHLHKLKEALTLLKRKF